MWVCSAFSTWQIVIGQSAQGCCDWPLPKIVRILTNFQPIERRGFVFISSSSANRKKRFYFQRKWKNGKMKNGKNALYRRPIPLNINIVSLEETFEFCSSSFADERNTLPKSTRRNVKLNIFAFGSPWLLLCKHWFMSSVWNFCRWVADVPCGKRPQRRIEERGETAVFEGYIDLVTVFDAIFMSRQTCEKLPCLYENLMSNNFRKMAALKNIWLVN